MKGFDHKNAKLSYSSIAQYGTCPWRWHAYYVRKLRRAEDPQPMQIGRLVHTGLAAALKSIATPLPEGDLAIDEDYTKYLSERHSKLDADQRAESLANADLAKRLMRRTLDEINQQGLIVVKDEHGPLIERKLEAPLRNWGGFVGYIDAVMRDPQGVVWLVDFKVRKAFRDDESEDYSLQSAIYQYLLHHNGVHTDGSIQFQVKNQLPQQPTLNKNGTMSRAACATDWATYCRALERNNLNPEDYEDMREKLATKEWFRLSWTYRTPTLLNGLWHEVVQPAAWSIGSSKHPWRNMTGLQCGWCWAKDLCLAEAYNPLDAERLLDEEYITVEDRHGT
jgi:hypothetical protein